MGSTHTTLNVERKTSNQDVAVGRNDRDVLEVDLIRLDDFASATQYCSDLSVNITTGIKKADTDPEHSLRSLRCSLTPFGIYPRGHQTLYRGGEIHALYILRVPQVLSHNAQ